MSLPQPERTRRIIYVSRQHGRESQLGARALSRLEGVRLLGICEQTPHAGATPVYADVVRVEDVHDAGQLIVAAREISAKHGALDRIVTAQETLLEAVAQANEALGLPGMSASTVRRVLDKPSLKRVLGQAGVATARDRIVKSPRGARRFAREVGFPLVLKPLGGSGGLATWCVRNDEQLDLALELIQPSSHDALLAEVYLLGQELCIDTITIANEPRFHSICCYRPSILQALENPHVQWTCVMPRDIDGEPFRDFTEQGLKAVRALSVGDAMTHMEGFLLNEGGLCFTDATLRPAGARIAPMLAFAYDIDPYRAWARVAVDASFDGPWERKYAVGTIFLRGTGKGLVERVEGIESAKRRIGEMVVEARLPRVGATKSATYTGDGYITIRHPETAAVEDALQLIAQTVRISYSQAAHATSAPHVEQWSQQLQHFDKQLNKPAWDDDSLPSL